MCISVPHISVDQFRKSGVLLYDTSRDYTVFCIFGISCNCDEYIKCRLAKPMVSLSIKWCNYVTTPVQVTSREGGMSFVVGEENRDRERKCLPLAFLSLGARTFPLTHTPLISRFLCPPLPFCSFCWSLCLSFVVCVFGWIELCWQWFFSFVL